MGDEYPLPGGGHCGVYPGVIFNLDLARYSHYYEINFILPLCAMIFLAWLGLFIPTGMEDGNRIGYGVTILFAAVAVNFVTADQRPATRENIWLDQFQTWAFIYIFIPIAETISLQRVVFNET